MKNAITLALLLNLGVASLYAHERPVKMSFSGTAGPTVMNLPPEGAVTSEYNFEGTGALGAFTFRAVSASVASPQVPITCSGQTQFSGMTVAGGAVLRFQDGSLLSLTLTEGSDCIDFAPPPGMAHCIRTFKVSGGTGRFAEASGTLTFDEILHPVVIDTNPPVFFSVTGDVTGTISGVHVSREGHEGDRQ